MKEQLPGDLFAEFEPEQAPLHELFLDALKSASVLRNAEAITEEEFDLLVRRMVAAVVASEFDSMMVDFFSSFSKRRGADGLRHRSSPVGRRRNPSPLAQ